MSLISHPGFLCSFVIILGCFKRTIGVSYPSVKMNSTPKGVQVKAKSYKDFFKGQSFTLHFLCTLYVSVDTPAYNSLETVVGCVTSEKVSAKNLTNDLYSMVHSDRCVSRICFSDCPEQWETFDRLLSPQDPTMLGNICPKALLPAIDGSNRVLKAHWKCC